MIMMDLLRIAITLIVYPEGIEGQHFVQNSFGESIFTGMGAPDVKRNVQQLVEARGLNFENHKV